MVDPVTGIIGGLLSQVFGDMVSDLIESLARPPRGAGVAADPMRVEPRRPSGLRPRRVDQAELDRLMAGLAARMEPVRRRAGPGLAEHEWVAALAAVRDTLAQAAPLDVVLVLDQARLDPERLHQVIRERAGGVLHSAALSAQAEGVYDHALRAGCAQIVEFITARPDFATWAHLRSVQDGAQILDRVEAVQQSQQSLRESQQALREAHDGEPARRAANELAARGRADREFTRRYARYLLSRLDALELVGVTLRQTPRRYALSTAYTSLSAARAAPAAGEELTGSGLRVADTLAGTTRALLRGTAGSGKTTAVQWLAMRASQTLLDQTLLDQTLLDQTLLDQTAMDDVHRGAHGAVDDAVQSVAVVPFVLPLRRFVSRGLPSPDEFLDELARPLAHAAPPGWVDRVLLSGAGLVLIDGVDEVPSQALPGASPPVATVSTAPPVATVRADVETWLAELTLAYPAARFVVTSRTSAVPDGWLTGLGFETYDLLPMGPQGIRDLVEKWHDAVAEGLPDAQAEMLRHYRTTLPTLITSRPELHRLAATPLLCALICALNWDRQMELPVDRAGIYEAALDMLLDRRDPQRGIAAPEGVEFAPREQSVLLQQLAYHLVKNELTELPQEAAVAQVGRAMARIRARDVPASDVLRHLVARTGLLRTDPITHGLHFVHRTFQDYLGAREALDEGDLGLLVHRGHDDRWRDVIIMAAAQGRPRESGALLAGLLDRGDREPGARERLHLLAAAAMAQAVVVEPPQVRRRVELATAALIPPMNDQTAESLARAGDFVVDLLPGPQGLSEQAAAYVVRTAALIGTEPARDLILQFIHGDPSPRLVDELLRAWRATAQPEEYARTVLAAVDFGDVTVAVHRHRLPYLRHLTALRAVKYLGDLVDLAVFAQLPALHRLELMQNDALRDRHLAALADCASLRELILIRCGSLRDLSGLAGIGLERLTLAYLDTVDVGSLAALGTVHSLSIRLNRLDDLTRLPAELPLRRLSYGGRLPRAALNGIERFPQLEHVDLVGAPTMDDVRQLIALPLLRSLVLSADSADSASSADWLAELRARRSDIAVRVQRDSTRSPVA